MVLLLLFIGTLVAVACFAILVYFIILQQRDSDNY